MKVAWKLFAIGLVLFGLTGVSIAGAAPLGAPPQTGRDVLARAVAGLGGTRALNQLSRFTIAANGTRWAFDEGLDPGADRIGPFEVQIAYDIAADALRLDYTAESRGVKRPVREVIAGQLGYIEGVDSNGGQPGLKNMSSDRWASIRKHQWLLNPHLILRQVLANPSLASDGGQIQLDGSAHRLLVVQNRVAPLTLAINASTGRIAKVTTMESDALRRDVLVEVVYSNWQVAGQQGLLFPSEVSVFFDGERVHQETRTAINVNPAIDAALFTFPAGVAPVYNDVLATRGEAFHQYHQSQAALGFPRDAPQTTVRATELAPGIFHLTGSSHNSVAIVQSQGITVLEAPFDEIRSQAVINWIKANFPNKFIAYVVSSHHHTDHSAGLRTYVAHGANIVMGESAKPFFERVFKANSNIVRDALANNPVAVPIYTVPMDGSFTIQDETQPVVVYSLFNAHARDMVISYVPNAGIVFVSDLYSPNPNATTNPGAGARAVKDKITVLGLDAKMIVGGHGGSISYDALLKLLEL
jgi:glyoxylase-like metal-dependent hydrolase (beta-lactamase superfamily II)